MRTFRHTLGRERRTHSRQGEDISIQKECAERNIDRLFHFTPIEHLDSILQHGMLTPNACTRRSIASTPNDAVRYDGQDAICLSIEWPNYKLFWNFRKRDTARVWAVISIQHRVMWEKRVCFNTTNAADNSMSGQSFAARQGLHKFQELFGDCSGKVRADLNLPNDLPTNPQAEVLCLDHIEPAYFHAVFFNDAATYNAFKARYPHAPLKYSLTYFSYRTDWSHWKNG